MRTCTNDQMACIMGVRLTVLTDRNRKALFARLGIKLHVHNGRRKV